MDGETGRWGGGRTGAPSLPATEDGARIRSRAPSRFAEFREPAEVLLGSDGARARKEEGLLSEPNREGLEGVSLHDGAVFSHERRRNTSEM